jgi:DNA helicase-4
MNQDALNGISLIKYVLVAAAILVAWLLYAEWYRRRLRAFLLALIPEVVDAISKYEGIESFEFYFSYSVEQEYCSNYSLLRSKISSKFLSIGLDIDSVDILERFIGIYDNIKQNRKNYNDLFVKKESEKFADFFNQLESYPLSHNQIEAIIRDEDNSLVIAGAGTGKTTTISAKVAYLLEKGLAKPEDLLIISFTKNAVLEMDKRTRQFCKNITQEDKLEVRTFNSFGYMVKRYCSHQDLRLAFDGDDERAKSFLQKTFDELFLSNENFQKKATNFIAFFNRPNKDKFDCETEEDHLENEKNSKNFTFDGKLVKSKEEADIANFFYLHCLNYEYEKSFPFNEEDVNHAFVGYRPDFYLSDYQIWHEHFGIDRNGEVPKWFSYSPPYSSAKESYNSIIKWKEGIHLKYNTKFIKTYSYENKEGVLLKNLKEKLEAHNIILNKRPADDILEVMQESEVYKDFMDLIYIFLGLMKSNNKEPSDLYKKGDIRLKVFLDVLKPLYEKYQEQLYKDSAIDYNDMITQAAYHINNGHYNVNYKYILVDEFQDMSLGRYDLIRSLKSQNPKTKLYAVGDDWQSIFRFTGSDISIITEFEKHFGYTCQTEILQTYRFNEEILNVTSQFVQRNPSQIKKRLKSSFKPLSQSFELIGLNKQGASNKRINNLKYEKINELLYNIEAINNGNTVFLIGRYNGNKPRRFSELEAEHPSLKIEFYTAHKSKGLTSDFTIILDIDSGIYGFPSEITDDPILNYLLKEGDSFQNAEERRLFYVALTRARHKNYLIYDVANPSKFLVEIRKDINLRDSVS